MTVMSKTELLGDPTGRWAHAGAAAGRDPARSARAAGRGIGLQVGEHLAVYAENDPQLVARAARLFVLAPTQVVRLEQRHGRNFHLPGRYACRR